MGVSDKETLLDGGASSSVRVGMPPMNRRKAQSPLQRAMLAASRSRGTTAAVAAGAVIVCWLLFSMTSVTVPGSLSPEEQPETAVRVDMHSHTTESDGDRTAEEQLQLAARSGLKAVWITDHDMIRDLERTRELQRAARDAGIHVGFGVEITVGWLKKEHHLLGYFPDAAWAGASLSPPMVELQKACAEVKQSRETRNNNLVRYINDLLGDQAKGAVYFETPEKARAFVPLDIPSVSAWAKEFANLLEPTSLGRPHFSKYLMTQRGVRKDLIFGPRDGDGYGVVSSDGTQVVFGSEEERAAVVGGQQIEALMHSATLSRRNIAFRPLPIEDAIRMITAAGGRAVVAHPPTLGPGWFEKFEPTVAALAKAGLWGFEAFSSEIDLDNHLKIHDIADRYGLQITGGSDNHGTLKTYAKLGQVHRDGADVYEQLSIWAREGLGRSQHIMQEEEL